MNTSTNTIRVNIPQVVKNDPEGRKFIQFLRKSGNRIKLRGRNADRKGLAEWYGLNHRRLRQDVPLKYATHFALYLY